MADGPPLLARLLGADRYLRFQYLLHEYPGVTVLLAGLPVALLGGALLLLIPDRQTLTLTPDGYLRVAVVFSEPIPSDDAEMSVRFHVELPDGARVAVRTDDMRGR